MRLLTSAICAAAACLAFAEVASASEPATPEQGRETAVVPDRVR
jgi:hypothetical protein